METQIWIFRSFFSNLVGNIVYRSWRNAFWRGFCFWRRCVAPPPRPSPFRGGVGVRATAGAAADRIVGASFGFVPAAAGDASELRLPAGGTVPVNRRTLGLATTVFCLCSCFRLGFSSGGVGAPHPPPFSMRELALIPILARTVLCKPLARLFSCSW